MSNIYEDLDIDKLKQIRLTVEDNASTIDDIVDDIIRPFCKDLDSYVKFIADCLKDGNNPPTNAELEDFCMNLSTYIYFAGGMCEQLGIKDDISKALWKETYNTKRDEQTGGTIADKNTFAELASQHEQLVNVCYSRAYKTMKAKVENAQELLSSCKKSLSHRMQELNLTHMTSSIPDKER